MDDCPRRNGRIGWLQFRLRTALFALLMVALALGWWPDHQQMQERLDRSEVMRQALQLTHMELGRDLTALHFWNDPDATVEPFQEYQQVFMPFLEVVDVIDVDGVPRVVRQRRRGPSKPEAVTELIARLNGDDRETRARAACTLRYLAGDKAIQPAIAALTAALKDEDRQVRWHAAMALGHAEAIPACAALRELVDGEDMPAFAAQMLRNIDPGADVAPRLAELLAHPRTDTRQRALAELTDIDNAAARAAWPAIRRLLSDKNTRVRKAAMAAAGKLAPVEEALDAMTKAFRAETDEALRKHAAKILIALDGREEEP